MWANLLCSLFLMCGPVAPVSGGLPTWAETSTHAIPLVARWEGLSVTAYLDTIAEPDVWTICYGETANVGPGEVRTVAECEAGLRRLLRDPTGPTTGRASRSQPWPRRPTPPSLPSCGT